jgi:hypothetical protein
MQGNRDPDDISGLPGVKGIKEYRKKNKEEVMV